MKISPQILLGVVFSVSVSSLAQASFLKPVSFPKTADDLSSAEKRELLTEGYKPFIDMDPYMELKIEAEVKRLEAIRQQDLSTMSHAEYCDTYPLDTSCGPTEDTLAAVVAIGNAPDVAIGDTPVEVTPVSRVGDVNPVGGTGVASQQMDNRSHNGACTPSAYSDHYVNKILTTGKYENIDPAFEKAMVQIFRAEGGCGSHPNDPGGYTCYGFAQNSNPDIDVRTLTRGGAEDRTYERFYKKRGIDRLPDAVRGDVLRGDFGSGPGGGIKILQKTLGLKQTGYVDDTLIAAAENYEGDLHNAFWNTRQQFLINLTKQKPERKVFLKGWMNGVRLFRENGCHVVPDRPLYRNN